MIDAIEAVCRAARAETPAQLDAAIGQVHRALARLRHDRLDDLHAEIEAAHHGDASPTAARQPLPLDDADDGSLRRRLIVDAPQA